MSHGEDLRSASFVRDQGSWGRPSSNDLVGALLPEELLPRPCQNDVVVVCPRHCARKAKCGSGGSKERKEDTDSQSRFVVRRTEDGQLF